MTEPLVDTAEGGDEARRQDALLKTGALQSAIFKSRNFSSIATDANGVIQIFNVGAESMLGYLAADVISKVTPAQISDPMELVARAKALSDELGTPIAPGFEALVFKASRGIEDIYELTYIRKDGSRLPAAVSVTALRDAQEAIIGYLLIGTDNTARKQIEDERRQLGQRLRDHQFYTRSLFEANIDALITTDTTGIITDVNKQMEALTGCTRDELIGAPFKSHFTDQQRAEAGIRLVLEEKKVNDYELSVQDRDGRQTDVSYNATTFYDRDRKLQGVFAAARDITSQKHLQTSLIEQTRIAEQANRAKTQFLANMSHEIRTPMNAVVGLSYLLGHTNLDAEQLGLLSKLKLASKSLLSVINDVLDLSKIEAGELIIESVVFRPRHLVQDLVDLMAPQAQAKGIGFESEVSAALPESLEGDAAHLTQIMINLVSNAIKFTETGGVRLRVRLLAATASTARLRFDVLDSGIGIAPDTRSRLFAPFVQADASITRRFGGTGLGLSIVKRLVKLMGGEVSLVSTPGVGSEFTVELDFALASAPLPGRLPAAAAGTGAAALVGVRVLVVDDSEINLDVAKRILELEGAQVSLAGNGLEALELLKARPHDYDVVLMDVQMPLLDGKEATRLIRRQPCLADLPVIALTAGALSSERQQVIAAGMDDFIGKPFEARDLIRMILRHAGTRREHGDPSRDAADAPPPGAAGAWPPVPGIDMTDARGRLCDDLALFRASLRRLLDEFADVAAPAPGSDADAYARHAGRMHKLRGCAGMLGAIAIARHAAAAEQACRDGAHEALYGHADALAGHLALLRANAAPVLDAATLDEPAPAAPPLPAEGALTAPVLAVLVDLLQRQSTAAIDRFKALAPAIRRLLDDEAYGAVRHHMDDMQFTDAARLLAAIRL